MASTLPMRSAPGVPSSATAGSSATTTTTATAGATSTTTPAPSTTTNTTNNSSHPHRRSGSNSSAKSKPGARSSADQYTTITTTTTTSSTDPAFTAATPILQQHSLPLPPEHDSPPAGILQSKPLPQPRLYAPPLRSQYPRENSENHVEYILVASFDIDRGSVMEHQYPAPISGDEHMLAELMLPDQTHMRSQDWTIFFLHKDTTAEDEAREKRKAKRRRRRKRKEAMERGEDVNGNGVAGSEGDGDEEDDEGPWTEADLESTDEEEIDDGPPLIYVLNLVNTKQDATVKRGAVVKAMAICTRHSFLHIYKPLLLLALEEYFRNPVLDTLASLYNAVNSMDLSLMPRLTALERTLLQSTDVKDMFAEKFQLMIQQRQAEDASRLSSSSATSSTSLPRYQLPRDTHEFESRVSYNNVPVPIKVPVAITPETVGDFSLIKLITTFAEPHRSNPQPFALHSHLTTSGPYTHPIIVLMNALLTQKRVIFLGHNQPSGSVAEAVLAACSLASGGILKGFTRHAFPYTDLTKIDDLLKVPGFIAGVTNPAFGLRTEWWDVLCDLPTGRMKISPKIEAPPLTEGTQFFQQGGHTGGSLTSSGRSNSNLNLNGMTSSSSKADSGDDPTGDRDFMDSVMSSIANRHGEAAVRSKFRSWVHRFTLLAATFEEIVYGASALHIGASETDADAYGFGVQGHGLVWADDAAKMKEINAQVGRIEGWRQSRSYFSLVRDLARSWEGKGAARAAVVRGIDLEYQIERLRIQRPGDAVAGDIFRALSRAVERAGLDADAPSPPPTPAPTDDQALLKLHLKREKARYDLILHLLGSLPESGGGLFYLSLGLFHRDALVRQATVRLLERVMVHDAGRHYWASLGRFAKLAFFRVKREEEGGGGLEGATEGVGGLLGIA